MTDRLLTEQEERAIRLVHHDHEGKTIEQASRALQITESEFKALLRGIRKKAPQLFPILTPRRKAILLLLEQGTSHSTITISLNLTKRQLDNDVRFLRKHKFWCPVPKTVRYEPGMDKYVRERF